MKRLKKGVLKILRKIEYYNIRKANEKKATSKKSINNTYLFILSPPFCGSTLLNEIISSSDNVSVNHTFGTREGQTLPKVRKIMFDHKRRWDETLHFDWQFIKKEWLKYWDVSKPILLEKSPPNIIRAAQIDKIFSPNAHIIFYRNPYAHCESMMRRSGRTPQNAAEFAIKCLKYQKQNIEILDNKMILSYEDLTDDSTLIVEKLVRFIPELAGIETEGKSFNSHNFMGKPMGITNLNDQKIKKLKKEDLDIINEVFKRHEELLSYFGYSFIN